jgi:hypothetical protein
MAAGLGFKDFVTGEVLTAADVDGYLMQGVWVFADAAARTAAVTSPQEGNISFLKDTNSTEYYSGSAWVAIGGSVPASYGLSAGKNAIINGSMDIVQRGTNFPITLNTTTYTLDRWCARRGANGETITQQDTSDNTNLPFLKKCLRIQRNSGDTSTTLMSISQSLETINSTLFAGRTVTVSFYARRGANFSATSNVFNCDVYTGTGTNENVVMGYTGSAQSGQVVTTLTTTWQRFSGSVNIPSTATEIALYFNYTPTGTAGAADFVEITGVQLELGTTATDFSRNGSTFQGELAACQRYYFKLPGSNNIFYAGFNNSTTEAYSAIPLPVTMRIRPTTTVTSAASNLAVRVSGGSNVACNGTTSIIGNTLQNLWFSTTVASGLTAGQGSALTNVGSAEAIEMSAEL